MRGARCGTFACRRSARRESMANRLANETSPYLLQHKDNPVDWYPWGEEALKKAREEDRPILLSVGYSACHWCHVLEREPLEEEPRARDPRRATRPATGATSWSASRSRTSRRRA